MKTLLISDMHGKSPSEFIEKQIKEDGIHQLACLGDYDTPQVLQEILGINIPKIILVGNHEWHYVHKYPLKGSHMNHNLEEYQKMWSGGKYPKEREFIQTAIRQIKRNRKSGTILEDKVAGRKVAFAHASLVNLQTTHSRADDCVWARMEDPLNAFLNFNEMGEKNYWIFFRGHDHKHNVLSIATKNKRYEVEKNDGIPLNGILPLDEDRSYIATIGAFMQGKYAILDSTKKTLEFRWT